MSMTNSITTLRPAGPTVPVTEDDRRLAARIAELAAACGRPRVRTRGDYSDAAVAVGYGLCAVVQELLDDLERHEADSETPERLAGEFMAALDGDALVRNAADGVAGAIACLRAEGVAVRAVVGRETRDAEDDVHLTLKW